MGAQRERDGQHGPGTGEGDCWRFWIDRGGTFTDCLGLSPTGELETAKVLSSDEAPVEAIQTILARHGVGAKAVAGIVCRIKLGTTVATNALLERAGIATALVTTRGLSDVFTIGTQERPALFELEIDRPEPLSAVRIEVDGRRDATGRRIAETDFEELARDLERAREIGVRAVAVVLMHAHAFPEDEAELARFIRERGFDYIVASHQTAREIGFLSRGETAIADAYLTPLLRGHLDLLRNAMPEAQLLLMQSSGGLTDAAHFRGPNALLSGPAGGVVATSRVARDAGFDRAIGFDMGGTSTDVCLVDGPRLDRAFESTVGGVRVKAPMLRIHTVAAGGGSLCRFDGVSLTVGPESAGSRPGPLCYGRMDDEGHALASELAITDINLALGRVASDRFPFALHVGPVRAALGRIVESLREAGFERSEDEVAAGFFEIANASMAQAIAEVSIARGVDPREFALVGYGGAGGQHVCAIARQLGIREILLHPHAGLLSAYGIGIAPLSWDGERDGLGRTLSGGVDFPESVTQEWQSLEGEAQAELSERGLVAGALHVVKSLDLGYAGTDTALAVESPGPDASVAMWRSAFEHEHRARFGYVRSDREIEIKAVRMRVEGLDEADVPLPMARQSEGSTEALSPARKAGSMPEPLRWERAWFPELGRTRAPLFEREALIEGDAIEGPAMILEATGTVVLDPGFRLRVEAGGLFRLSSLESSQRSVHAELEQADPVRLEVLGNRFMSIAEQMGAVLRNTSVSTNIKERLDYSCAVFDSDGGLVANAPHIPVHLGAMSDTVDAIRRRFEPVVPGEVFVTNDPFAGGSHLPDITVVTPVFLVDELESSPASPRFFVASRGHHADIGGKTPGSMPSDSSRLEEEGVLIESFRLVREGHFDEERLRSVLASGPHPARRPDDNVADLEAMVAANRAGERLLRSLVDEVGEDAVQVTMHQLQTAAAAKVAHELTRLAPGEHHFADALDDGTPIVVTLRIEHGQDAHGHATARMAIDFAGTGPASQGNLNAPSAVVRAAVIYVLRSLVDERIPLNGGCLTPVEIRIPEDSILDPPRGSAVVGGNVETSQRVVDVLLGALGRAAASQGTMNNVTFGDDRFGYYETIGGGAGATPRAAGASGVHTHMTNTRITDAEVLESRFPVRLVEFGLRRGSGGSGAHPGGEGIVRHYRFLRPVTVSVLTERRERAPFGLAGGGAGACGRNQVLRREGELSERLPGCAEVSMAAGDELRIETPGGGGYGDVD